MIDDLTNRILSTMNGSHELTAEQRAELRDPKHADVAKHLHPTYVIRHENGNYLLRGTDSWGWVSDVEHATKWPTKPLDVVEHLAISRVTTITESPSPATPTQPAPTDVAGGGAGDPPFRVVGTDIWCGARVVDQLLTVSMARHICDLLNRAYWFGHETCARGMQP